MVKSVSALQHTLEPAVKLTDHVQVIRVKMEGHVQALRMAVLCADVHRNSLVRSAL